MGHYCRLFLQIARSVYVAVQRTSRRGSYPRSAFSRSKLACVLDHTYATHLSRDSYVRSHVHLPLQRRAAIPCGRTLRHLEKALRQRGKTLLVSSSSFSRPPLRRPAFPFSTSGNTLSYAPRRVIEFRSASRRLSKSEFASRAGLIVGGAPREGSFACSIEHLGVDRVILHGEQC